MQKKSAMQNKLADLLVRPPPANHSLSPAKSKKPKLKLKCFSFPWSLSHAKKTAMQKKNCNAEKRDAKKTAMQKHWPTSSSSSSGRPPPNHSPPPAKSKKPKLKLKGFGFSWSLSHAKKLQCKKNCNAKKLADLLVLLVRPPSPKPLSTSREV